MHGALDINRYCLLKSFEGFWREDLSLVSLLAVGVGCLFGAIQNRILVKLPPSISYRLLIGGRRVGCPRGCL